MAGAPGFEPGTLGFGIRCSGQLSYTPADLDNSRALFLMLKHLNGKRLSRILHAAGESDNNIGVIMTSLSRKTSPREKDSSTSKSP